MARYTPAQYRRLLKRAPDRLEAVVQKIARIAQTRIGGAATTKFMRRAFEGEGPRSPFDEGDLRIVSGDLARAVIGKDPAGSVRRVETIGRGFEIFTGVNLEAVPQGYNEVGVLNGFGRGIEIPARPFLDPAMEDQYAEIVKRAARIFVNAMKKHF